MEKKKFNCKILKLLVNVWMIVKWHFRFMEEEGNLREIVAFIELCRSNSHELVPDEHFMDSLPKLPITR